MKNKTFKLFLVFSLVFLMTGCTKILTDENKKTVKYDSKLICESCEKECSNIEKENSTCTIDKEGCTEADIKNNDEKLATCKKNCENKCALAKKNATGQSLTKNILCKPTNSDVIELYEKNGVDIKSLPDCSKFNAFSSYEGVWINVFVRPLAWLLIKTGVLLKNYGLALVIISILIRAALMPLTTKTLRQSENLKKAQPEIDRINRKYENKNDQDSMMQKSQETLMLYKKYNINPLSSCIFAFIQIPLLFAFIEAINRTPALFEGRFLGLHLGLTPLTALSRGEWWYLIIVIILAAVTYYSLNFNKTISMDNDAEKQMNMMNKVMLAIIVMTSFTLSTAICLYWIASSLFTVLQNIIMKRVKK